MGLLVKDSLIRSLLLLGTPYHVLPQDENYSSLLLGSNHSVHNYCSHGCRLSFSSQDYPTTFFAYRKSNL